MRGVLPIGLRGGQFHVLAQRFLVIRVCAVLDDRLGALPGCQAAQVGQSLLRDDQVYVVFGVVHMADHRGDGRDRPALRRRRSHEGGEEAVAGEVARAADAVLHPGAHDVGGVDVAVDVGLDHAIAGDDTHAADWLWMVGDVLRAQNDLLGVVGSVLVHLVCGLGGQRERRGGGHQELAGVQQVDHAVLDHLGV